MTRNWVQLRGATFHRGQCVLLTRVNASRIECADNQIGKYHPLYRVVFLFIFHFFLLFLSNRAVR